MAVWAREAAGEQLLHEEVGQQHEGLVLQTGYAGDRRLEVLALELGMLAAQQMQQHAVPSPASQHEPLGLCDRRGVLTALKGGSRAQRCCV